ncbi:hypothetical protein, partial [Acidithiobacillus sp.]|uniref:hypothetical protein n=1 Tax=Acidithiobacillus sp. TaxID=1872118 RepID=UPI003D07400A
MNKPAHAGLFFGVFWREFANITPARCSYKLMVRNISDTNIFPAPFFPVLAVLAMQATTSQSRSLATISSI